jgi:shikimate kinase
VSGEQSITRLVLITGPIASGKTTAALALATKVRETGLRAAAIDMDVMVEMLAGTDWSLITAEDRRSGQRIAASTIDRLIGEGAKVVAAAGSTISRYEWDDVLAGIRSEVSTTFVLLEVSLEESIRRAHADPTRGATKNPAVVTRIYAENAQKSMRPYDLTVSTDGQTPDAVASTIADRVFRLP